MNIVQIARRKAFCSVFSALALFFTLDFLPIVFGIAMYNAGHLLPLWFMVLGVGLFLAASALLTPWFMWLAGDFPAGVRKLYFFSKKARYVNFPGLILLGYRLLREWTPIIWLFACVAAPTSYPKVSNRPK